MRRVKRFTETLTYNQSIYSYKTVTGYLQSKVYKGFIREHWIMKPVSVLEIEGC